MTRTPLAQVSQRLASAVGSRNQLHDLFPAPGDLGNQDEPADLGRRKDRLLHRGLVPFQAAGALLPDHRAPRVAQGLEVLGVLDEKREPQRDTARGVDPEGDGVAVFGRGQRLQRRLPTANGVHGVRSAIIRGAPGAPSPAPPRPRKVPGKAAAARLPADAIASRANTLRGRPFRARQKPPPGSPTGHNHGFSRG